MIFFGHAIGKKEIGIINTLELIRQLARKHFLLKHKKRY